MMMPRVLMCPAICMAQEQNAYLLFTIKVVLMLMLFTCLLVMMVRQRITIQVLKEIRDKK
ncbi:MAG TPA: hypothetical protein PLU24_03665 [Candidatus Omnitrophota bacterium]|nr:hypothetical protein [Candidatus Omnitrophota bacterium]